jgi:hypothetical protein
MKRSTALTPFTALAALAAFGGLGLAHAHDYPTTERVEYVLECMKKNGGSQAYLYKCSCAIDAIAKQMSLDEYVESSAVARYQGMGGERSGVFRDPDSMKDAANRYRSVHAAARKECDVPR